MPCQSYESNWANDSNDREIRKLKKEADKLARIACKALTALEEMEQEDFLLLKDNEVREWWVAHKEADRKEQERIAEKLRRERVKEEALASLSDEAKELLGLSPKKKLSGNTVHVEPYEYECDTDNAEYGDWGEEVKDFVEDLHTIAGTIVKTYRVK